MPPEVESLVASDLILEARDAHPSFVERRHPDPLLVRALSRYQRRLVARIIRFNATLMVQSQDSNVPALIADQTVFNAGITLPDYKYPAQVEITRPATAGRTHRPVPLDLISWERLSQAFRCVAIRDHKMYLAGKPADWSEFETLTFYYMPEVDDLANAKATLVVPNSARAVLVAYLCWFMTGRGQKDPEVEAPDKMLFKTEWDQASKEFEDEMTLSQQAESSIIKETF